MSLKKYVLENLPNEGKIQFEQSGGRPIVLDDNLTGEQCEFLLNGGNNQNAAYYIKPKSEKAQKAETTPATTAK